MGKIGRASLPQKDKPKEKTQTLDTYLAKKTGCTVHWSGDGDEEPTEPARSQDHFPKSQSRDALLIDQLTMLRSELDITSKKITSSLSKEIREIGKRTDTLESRMEDTTTVLGGPYKDLRYQLQELQDKLEDIENRSCRGNIRIRGFPETYQNLEEFDRIHRALGRPPQEGNPGDMILQLHYYTPKETIMQAARQSSRLDHDCHVLQLFNDIAPGTIVKRRSFKPITAILQTNNVKYRWAFPFQLHFAYRVKQILCNNIG
ncbi:hypothetical protein XELAEV_18041989mg [Xenopus laevis]|uniref:L1 transposable element RRM domain-containing protein n=1 Tax=Xenopus laevis TaxID=8355 RepID=A0A974H636_XENLA|nr:hypothetical protein XELAEV_18041989mg [Xenopus laevis]